MAPWLGWLLTLVAVNWAWVFFRLDINEAWLLTEKLVSPAAWSDFQLDGPYQVVPIVFFLAVVGLDHWFRYYHVDEEGALQVFGQRTRPATYVYVIVLFALAAFYSGQPIPFIYFEF